MAIYHLKAGKFMKSTKAAAIFAIIVGVSMLGMWGVFYLTDNIPELETKPIELTFHLIAELITAVFLIIAGVGVLKQARWGYNFYLIATGMVLYTMIMSPGYFLQAGDFSFLIMFLILIVLALYFLQVIIKNKNNFIYPPSSQ